ncbi:hypothetical protein GCM10009802_15780 [Streptomyces synnematoformans]|uniref:SDR family oxidoreductase n=1 Tax=Streptomyces synnematoformans TaxID=415721 RepID=A0ABN2XS17_9ACTN
MDQAVALGAGPGAEARGQGCVDGLLELTGDRLALGGEVDAALPGGQATFIALREAAQRISDHGRIIQISSALTVSPLPGMALLIAGKTADDQLARTLAWEVGSRSVTVNSVLPRLTRTAVIATVPRTSSTRPRPAHRWAAWANPRTSPTSSRSWLATPPAGSPAKPSTPPGE